MTMADTDFIGKSWTIREPFHAGHILTIRGRDQVEKHQAWWIDCSCGASFLMGDHWLPSALADEWSPYDEADAHSKPHRRPLPKAI